MSHNPSHHPYRTLGLALFLALAVLGFTAKPVLADNELTSLITETPEEGFALAVKLSQKGVTTTQTDPAVRQSLRDVYERNPDSLIEASKVIAINYRTVAEANNYWRD